MNIENENIKRGDIYYADLSPVRGSEQSGIRPVVIIQNNKGNIHSSTVIVAAITSKINKGDKMKDVHIKISSEKYGLNKDSIILCEQIRTLEKKERLKEKIAHLDEKDMKKLDKALAESMSLSPKHKL